MWKAEFLLVLDAQWANVSVSTKKRWRDVASLEKRLRIYYFCKQIDTEHLRITSNSHPVPILHINIQVRKIAFSPF